MPDDIRRKRRMKPTDKKKEAGKKKGERMSTGIMDDRDAG